jgi:hypothetical protein
MPSTVCAPILWNKPASACTRSKMKDVSEEMERDSWATFWSEKKEKEKGLEREKESSILSAADYSVGGNTCTHVGQCSCGY